MNRLFFGPAVAPHLRSFVLVLSLAGGALLAACSGATPGADSAGDAAGAEGEDGAGGPPGTTPVLGPDGAPPGADGGPVSPPPGPSSTDDAAARLDGSPGEEREGDTSDDGVDDASDAPMTTEPVDANDANAGLDASLSPDARPDTSPDSSSPDSSGSASLDSGGRSPDASADAAPDATTGVDAAADATAPSIDAGPPPVDCALDAGGAIGASGAPHLLACTGLYSDFAAGTIASSAMPYDPGLHLWTDGATKRRFIYLPPGTQIDTSNMNEWTFPVGTKVWKEFSLNGAKIETRFLNKVSSGNWAYTTYQWSADQTTATELTTGATNVAGTTYQIPDLDNCRVCHMGRLDYVLGFEAVGLSTSMASGLDMATLVQNGWLTNPPATPIVIPGDATASAALGWLHANCGNACHNPSNYSLAGPTGFFMRLETSELGSVEATNTYTTGVNVVAGFKPPDGGTLLRIAPGNPAGSCVIFRDGYRDTDGEGIQMPPIDTHIVDTADVATVSSWITSLGQ